jgi:adenylate kinase family enzyme
MLLKSRLTALLIIALLVITVLPASAMLYGQASVQAAPAEEMIKLADRAAQQVKNLIDLVQVNETALQAIESVGLDAALEGNVSLYNEGARKLSAAHDALAMVDYEAAVDYATESLRIFREVFQSIHVILEKAELQKGQMVDNQGLLEAITREIQRIDCLREVLLEDVPEEIEQWLDNAKSLLDMDAARALLLEGNAAEVISRLQSAKEMLSQVYAYLKAKAKESTAWRIYNYCQRIRERISEEFRRGNQTGVDFTGVLESLGYQFMEALEGRIQVVQNKTDDFQSVRRALEELGQMVQEMDQALTQEMKRCQGGSGSGGVGSNSGSSNGGMVDGYGQGNGGKP